MLPVDRSLLYVGREPIWMAKGRYVLSCGGRLGNFGILVKKSVGPPFHFNKKTPDPPPLGDCQKCDPPLNTTWYVSRGMELVQKNVLPREKTASYVNIVEQRTFWVILQLHQLHNPIPITLSKLPSKYKNTYEWPQSWRLSASSSNKTVVSRG